MKRRAEDSIDQEENMEKENYQESNDDGEDDSHYIHRFIPLEEGWNDIIKPKVSVCMCVWLSSSSSSSSVHVLFLGFFSCYALTHALSLSLSLS
jgi:hypothetical protein